MFCRDTSAACMPVSYSTLPCFVGTPLINTRVEPMRNSNNFVWSQTIDKLRLHTVHNFNLFVLFKLHFSNPGYQMQTSIGVLTKTPDCNKTWLYKRHEKCITTNEIIRQIINIGNDLFSIKLLHPYTCGSFARLFYRYFFIYFLLLYVHL